MTLDATRRGSREYTPEQQSLVIRVFADLTDPMTVEELAAATGVPGRTARQILSDADGEHILVAGGDGGLMPARSQEEAERLTRRIRAQASRMMQRVERRESKTRHLPRSQNLLPF